MGLEVNVYARRAEPISIDEIRDHMRKRGSPVTWKYAPLTEHLGPRRWLAGRFSSEAHPEAEVVIGREDLSVRAREEVADAHRTALSPTQRKALLAGESRYGLGSEGTPEHEANRLLVQLVDVIAEQSDGLIHDVGEEQFFDREAFRTRYAAQLRGQR
ncbi:MAG: hypothetical protein AUI36_01640 [Cyanobacteria bacterium 13_1_40CM_2_61_4]|nr:MAG: hypothetical protein AUI36_01640 [Cyanobacteria bacterium 13_1_40CM_2_61_4]